MDDAGINKSDEELFTKVADFSIISTNTSEKKIGNWAKVSTNSYVFYLDSSYVIFTLEDNSFVCKSQKDICQEIN